LILDTSCPTASVRRGYLILGRRLPTAYCLLVTGERVQRSEVGVQRSEFKVQSSEFRVQGSEFREKVVIVVVLSWLSLLWLLSLLEEGLEFRV